MDFSENLSQQYKYEPQSLHFSKRQFSLHCTVKHLPNSLEYIYHLSNEMKHNYAFTATVLRQLIHESSSVIIRLKSDNCATQHKSKYVFKAFHSLAVKMQKKVGSFYGTAGHEKGLVDAMSSFGVKAPICRAVLREDFSYRNANDIFDYLTLLFGNDINKHILDGNEIQDVKHSVSGSYKIKKCRSLHMISYFPDGSIQTKQHLCSCVECVARNFIDCNLNPGVKFIVENTEGSDTDTSDTDTDESDTDDDEEC